MGRSNVCTRRKWEKFGDCEGQGPGFKENGVVNIAEKARAAPTEIVSYASPPLSSALILWRRRRRRQVSFDLAGGEEAAAPDASKGVNSLLNMDTFSVLRQLRQKMQVCVRAHAARACARARRLHPYVAPVCAAPAAARADDLPGPACVVPGDHGRRR